MAYTWNKFKNKVKKSWKKGQSRSQNHRKKNKSRHNHTNTSHRSILQQLQTHAPPAARRNKQNRSKKKSSKSNLFGCFTTIPNENPSINLDDAPKTANSSNQQQVPLPSPSSQSDSIPSKHDHIPPLKALDLPPTLHTIPKASFRPHSPSKSATETPCFNNISSKYIAENPSVHSLYSDHPAMNSIKYNMTPTPQSAFTDFTDNDYDIYDGVIEVEDDHVIDEDDINNYYNDDEYDSHGDIACEEDDDMIQQRDSVIKSVQSPQCVQHDTDPMVFSVDRHSMNHHPPQDASEYMHNDPLFMQQLMLSLRGYDPQLHDITEQMGTDRGAQMYQIYQYVCDNNKMMESAPRIEDNEDEDDDIKLEFNPQHTYNYPCNDAPHIDIHRHDPPQYHHAGPLRCTIPSDINEEEVKTATSESPQSILSAAATSNNNNNSSNRIRSNSSLGEEPEFLDGNLFHEKYVVGHKINEGGFGSVWHIIDNNLYSKCVKIMELGKDEENQSRRRKACIREYNMTRKAFSDEIIEVELFVDNINMVDIPRAYLIMPYFEGKDLFEFIDDDEYFKKVSVATMLHIFYKIAEKLYDLHYFKKIVHGDLKPENVMILQSHNCDDIEVEIIDYGIAKSIRNLSSDKKYLKSKGHFGTKGYVAPELMRESKYNRKIDVFSAGVVLYNMVTECCLFPKGHKYYRLSQGEYYKYLKKKFKCIKKKKMVMDILYSCLAYDPDERLDVKQLIERYFHAKR